MENNHEKCFAHLVELARKLERKKHKLDKIKMENQRLNEEIARMRAARSRSKRGRNAAATYDEEAIDVAPTEDEEDVPVVEPSTIETVVLTPTEVPRCPRTGETISIEEWRNMHGITSIARDLPKRFIDYVKEARAYLLDGKHVLFVNMWPPGRVDTSVRLQSGPVLSTLCRAASVQEDGELPTCINTPKADISDKRFSSGMILGPRSTGMLIRSYGLPERPNFTSSYIIPNVTDLEELRRVMAYAHQ